MSARRSVTLRLPFWRWWSWRTPPRSTGGVQRLDHLVGDVVLGIDINRLLKDQVVFFGFGQGFDNLVGALNHLLEFFILAGVQVFLELAALALEIPVLVHQLLLPRGSLAFGQRG